jgi:hypothetical protein
MPCRLNVPRIPDPWDFFLGSETWRRNPIDTVLRPGNHRDMGALLLVLMAATEVAATPSLESELLANIGAGGSVAILPSAEGLVATSADGARRRVLAPGPVEWALVDNRAQVIWFGRRKEVRILDLAAHAPAPELIGTQGSDAPIEISYARGEHLIVRVGMYDPHLVLRMNARAVRWDADLAIYGEISDQDGRDAKRLRASVKWADGGRARVQALAERGKGRPLLAATPPEVPKVASVPAAECEAAELCGSAKRLGKTRFFAVIASHTCGDACHTDVQLYDSGSQEFVDAARPDKRSRVPFGASDDAARASDAWVAPGSEGFVSNGKLYHFERGHITGSGHLHGGGWLGRQWHAL